MIMLGDDQPVAMVGLRTLLETWGILLEIPSSPDETLRRLAHARPPLVVTGFFLTDAGRMAMDLVCELHQRHPNLALLVRAPVDDPHLRVRLRALGASGLIATSADEDALHEAVRTVMLGGRRCTPIPPGTPLLSPRDLRILQQLRVDTGHKSAAHTVGTSRTAVDKRLAKLRQRFGVGSTAALVAYMVEGGWLTCPRRAWRQMGRRARQQDNRTADNQAPGTKGQGDVE